MTNAPLLRRARLWLGPRLHTVAVDEAPAGDRAGARMRRWCGR